MSFIGIGITIAHSYLTGVGAAAIKALSGMASFIFEESEGVSSTYVGDAIGDDRTSGREIQPGRCYEFDGTNDYVTFPGHSRYDLQPSSDWTVWGWLSVDTISNFKSWSGRKTGAEGWQFDQRGGGKFGGSLTDGITTVSFTSTTTLSTDTLYFVVYSHNGADKELSVYLNGVSDSAAINTSALSDFSYSDSDPIYMGARSGGSNVWLGKMKDICFANSFVTESEALAAFNNNGVFESSAISSTTLHFKCEESAGSTAYDSSGNANHGTITNANLSTFHATDVGVVKSYANDFGYSDGEQLVPPASAFFNTDGTSYWSTVRSTVSYNASGWLTFTATGTVPGIFKSNLLTAGVLHNVKFRAKGNQASGAWKSIGDNNNTDVTVLNPDITTDWQDYEFNITPTGTLFRMYLDGIATDIVDIDDIFVTDSRTGIIPRDESDITKDIRGCDLDYTDRVKYDFDLKSSNCLTFDGTNDYVDISGALPTSNLMLGTGITIACWAKRNGNSGAANMLFSHRDQSTQLLQCGLHSTNGVTMQFRSSTNTLYSILDSSVDDTVWHHYTFVFDFNGDEMRLYVDGVESDQTAIVSSGSLDSAETYLGAFSSTGSGPNGGYAHVNMSGVFVKQSVLSDANITLLYQAAYTGACLANYPLAEGSGSTAYDISGNDSHGTLTNFTLSSAWGTTQDVYHYNIKNGFTLGVNYQPNSEDPDEWRALGGGSPTHTGSGEFSFTSGAGNIYLGDNSSKPELQVGDTTGRTITLSFYARFVSGTNGTYKITLSKGDTTEVASSVIVLTTTLQRFEITTTFTGNASGELEVYFRQDSSGSSVIELCDPQIEEAATATNYQATDGASIADVYVPALASGSDDVLSLGISNPTGAFHNGSESKYAAKDCPALRVADDAKTTARLFSGANPVELGYSDFEEDFDDEGFYFSDTSTANERKNLLIFDEEKTGSDLTDIQTFLNH